MRPVNLIALEERHGEHAPLRSGPLAYILVGALVLALAGVAAVVLTGNQISNRKDEIVRLKGEDAVATARAQKLSAYTAFQALREQRVATVTSLANSRFDWERVMRELSRILPGDVWLTSLNATASPGASAGESGGSGGGSSGVGIAGSIAGPSLQISGCAKGQDGVAGFVTALKDIDGVTRVGVQSSALAAPGSRAGEASSGNSGGGGGSGGGAADCRTREFIAQFQMTVAFDAAPVAATGSSEAAPSATEPAQTTAAKSPEGGG